MKKIILILALLFFNSVLLADAITKLYEPPCIFTAPTNSLAGVGDSRANQMDFLKQINEASSPKNDAISVALSPANDKGKLIIAPGQVNMITRSFSGSTSEWWVNKINSCGTFYVPDKVFLNLGGNDIINLLKKKKDLQEDWNAYAQQNSDDPAALLYNIAVMFITKKYSVKRSLTIRNVLNEGLKLFNAILDKFKAALNISKPNKIRNPASDQFNFHNFWQWRSDQKLDEVALNMKTVSMHLLNQGATKVLLNTEAPVSLLDIRKLNQDDIVFATITDSFSSAKAIAENFPDALKLFFNLRMKYMWDVYPYLSNRKPLQIAWLDSYDIYFNNILRQQSSYYSDGIHFTREGLLEWGREMATAMVQFGWYTPGDGYTTHGQPKFYSDLDVHKYHMYTTFKAIENNVPWNVVLDREMQFQNTGFAKDFPENGTTVYIMKDDNDVYTLSGIIRDKYKQMGEGKGALGFPTGGINQIHFGTIDRVNFECGYIDHNRLDLLNPNNTSVHITKNECQQ